MQSVSWYLAQKYAGDMGKFGHQGRQFIEAAWPKNMYNKGSWVPRNGDQILVLPQHMQQQSDPMLAHFPKLLSKSQISSILRNLHLTPNTYYDLRRKMMQQRGFLYYFHFICFEVPIFLFPTLSA